MKDYKELRKLLIDKDMKQVELANAITMPVATLSKIMNGEREFRASEIKAIVDAMGINPAEIPAYFFE